MTQYKNVCYSIRDIRKPRPPAGLFLSLPHMKKHLLLAFLLAFTFPAFAQYEALAVAGVSAGLSDRECLPQ
jgi:hypothetical protein